MVVTFLCNCFLFIVRIEFDRLISSDSKKGLMSVIYYYANINRGFFICEKEKSFWSRYHTSVTLDTISRLWGFPEASFYTRINVEIKQTDCTAQQAV